MYTFHRLRSNVGMNVLRKFNYTCCFCMSKENLCVHHIKRMNADNAHYNDEHNLMVLCRSCHMKLHRNNGDVVPTNAFKKGVVSNPNGRRGNTPEVFCKINGCNEKQHARELCKKHYEYYRKHKIPW